jgi:hypothetical protein
MTITDSDIKSLRRPFGPDSGMNSSGKVRSRADDRQSLAKGEYFAVAVVAFYLTVSIITEGGVELFDKSILAAIAVVFCASQIGKRVFAKVALVSTVAQVILGLLTFAVLAQSFRSQNTLLHNPIWAMARQSLPDLEGAISVAPEQSFQALVTFAPIFMFIAVLKLCRDDVIALRIIKILVVIATVAALFGVLSLFHVFEYLGAPPKQFYQGSLTSFFVNRNTAGTFFGLGVLVSFSLALGQLQRRRLNIATLYEALVEGRNMPHKFPVVVMINTLILFTSLALTQSRGAVAATVLSLVIYWLLVSKSTQEIPSNQPWVLRFMRFSKTVFSILLALVIVAFFAARVLGRQETEGVDIFRLCTYQSTWQMGLDNWPTGSGLGTFSDVFPNYRMPECLGLWGHWEMAHNFFLEGFQSLGAVFSFSVLASYVALLWAFVQGLRIRSHHRTVPALGLCALVLVSAHSLVDFSLQIPGVANFVAVLLGACVAVSLNPEKQGQRKRHHSFPRAARTIVVTPVVSTGPLQTMRGAATFTPKLGDTQPPPASGGAPRKS